MAMAENAAGGIGSAEDLIPKRASVKALADAADECRACRLWKAATQTVFGEGRAGARILLVGEQPGDREDLAKRPFVGPAGRLLDSALDEAGIDRADVYVTNAVKHFKFEPRGKRRIHKKPAADEIAACHPWLEAEIATVKPEVIVCLGATAAQALIGRQFRVSRERGTFIRSPLAPWMTATVHPSSILRATDDDTRHVEMRAFVHDLQLVARKVQG
jgi:uracil-DNA glycosylase